MRPSAQWIGSVFILLLYYATSHLCAGEPAKDEANTPVLAQYLFDRKATDWVEGTVRSIGETKFTVNKTQSFFAARYAKMLHEINEKTVNFPPSEAARKASEIRARWYQEVARLKEDPMLDKELMFLLPQQLGGLQVLDESGLYWRERISTSGDSRLTAAAYGKALTWDDIKAGDRVVVGYQTNTDNRNALVIIRVSAIANMDFDPGRGKDPKPGSTRADTTKPP